MKYASFFSGIGGFELALDAAGHKRVFSCEVDPFCNKVAKERFGHEHSEKDIKKVSAERIPQADLWVGGFPCQDLSVAGKRGGITEERSGLVWRLLELAKVRAPRYLFLENVPGLLNSKRGGDLALLVRKLAHLGYVGCYRVLDAQYCGVPQRRRRVFIVGHLGAECPLEVLFEPKGGRRDSEKGGQTGKAIALPPRKNSAYSGDKGSITLNLSRAESEGADKGAEAVKGSEGHRPAKSPDGGGSGDLLVEPVAFDGHNKPKTKTGTLIGGHKAGGRNDLNSPLVFEERKILGQAMTSKWSKGSSGPAGDEHHNLIVSAPLTAGSHPNSHAPGRRSEDDVNLVAGTLQASGAGTSRPAGMASEPDFLVLHANEKAATLPADRRLQTDGNRDNVIAIQDIRGKRDKKQNGIGIQPGAPGYTVDSTSRHGVAIPSVVSPTLGEKNEPCTSASTREEWMKICAERDMGMGMGMSVRRLTPTECERLQGFPDGWTCLCGVNPDCPDRRIPPWVDPESFTLGGCGHSACGCTCPDSPRYKALGNAVAVPAVRWIGDRIPI